MEAMLKMEETNFINDLGVLNKIKKNPGAVDDVNEFVKKYEFLFFTKVIMVVSLQSQERN